MKSTRWGLIGAGWIATRTIAPAMHAADDTIVQAVASRDSERAQSLNPVTVHQSVADFINNKIPMSVTTKQSRDVVAIMQAAEESARANGRSVEPALLS